MTTASTARAFTFAGNVIGMRTRRTIVPSGVLEQPGRSQIRTDPQANGSAQLCAADSPSSIDSNWPSRVSRSWWVAA